MASNILVVDDATFARLLIKKIIKDVGMSEIVYEASNGYDAIKLSKEYQPIIIFLDITMPGLDGIEALPEILKESPDSKVIMCSSVGQYGAVVQAFKLGAFDFIVKPLEKDRVIKAIQRATKERF